jgi:N-acetyl-1-D-myo-inositol-2-amino-2-deoxy-alpha-D-glucopyranoside deacetylase
MKIERLNFLTIWGRPLLIVIILVTIVLGVRQLAPLQPETPLSSLKPFSLAGYQRLLILAPHCDDETLASAGLILAARRAGIEVRVVIATNGDGYRFATMEEFRRLYPSTQNFIQMGTLRQQESLAALVVLGVQPTQVSFLSYPDRGSPFMWNDYWTDDHPYRSPYSGDTRSPYPLTYNPDSVYAGEDFLADIISILENYQPDLIIYPNLEDTHPDHWGLNVFTRLALTLLAHRDLTFRPAEYTYLVHRPDFPVVHGLKPAEILVPPPAVYAVFPDWYQWDLTNEDESVKAQAIQQYRSQLPLSGGLLESFIRMNELFTPAEVPATLKMVSRGDLLNPSSWQDDNGLAIPPTQSDPSHDSFIRDAVSASDLTALFAAYGSNGHIWLCGELLVPAGEDITYLIHLKALTKDGVTAFQARTGKARTGWEQAQSSGRYFCAQVSMSSLGDPWAIFTSVESLGLENMVFDQTGWQMIMVKP